MHLNLELVSRSDELLRYCSKVPWRFYDSFGADIEDAGFYFGADKKWTAICDTLLYKIYYAFLDKYLPSRWARLLANKKLKRILGELITPDELWYRAQGNVTDHTLYGETLVDFRA